MEFCSSGNLLDCLHKLNKDKYLTWKILLSPILRIHMLLKRN